MNNVIARPVVKWIGGKQELIPQIRQYYPKQLMDNQVKKYVEPFVGGGAMFFDLNSRLNFEEVVLNDLNPDLILVYTTVRDFVYELISALNDMESQYVRMSMNEREVNYYKIRSEYNFEGSSFDYKTSSHFWILRAAKFIYLNKTCFRGLYRTNQSGGFNASFGLYANPPICDSENLINANRALKGVTLTTGDFSFVTRHIDIDESTYVYMDPPYRPISSTSNFTKYTKTAFNDDTQIRLANFYKTLHDEKKALVMLSNSDPTNTVADDMFFENLYSNFTINRLYTSRKISTFEANKKPIREILVSNEAQRYEQIGSDAIC